MASTPRKPATATGSSYARIYAAVRRIPHGKVATYGEIARLADLAGHARQVGYALHALDSGSTVPWHRVVNARGEVSPRAVPGWEDLQRDLLEQEDVELARGRVDLARYGWKPRSPGAPRSRKAPRLPARS